MRLRAPLRSSGIVAFLLGLMAVFVGTFNGCGSLFTFNGRHAIDVRDLDDKAAVAQRGDGKTAITQPLVPVAGRRYTLAVQVVFDREGLSRREGVIQVEAKMPLVVRVTDRSGTSLAQVTGWLDPNEPPNVLYGQAAHESTRGPMPDLVVERLVGPFNTAGTEPLSVEIDLGADRVGTAQITSRRLVVHDDALPGAIRNAFIAAAVGGVLAFVGLVMIALGVLRDRFRARQRARARNRVVIPASDVV